MSSSLNNFSQQLDPSEIDFQAGSMLLIDKPLDWTSFDVVNKIRYKLKYSFGYKKIKVGHAGTLDPLATGLLIVCTGKFTKRINELQDLDKEYSGSIFLGATTPSYDAESEINKKFPIDHISDQLINETAKTFLGPQLQVPPLFSAIKIKGQTAYHLARRGEEIALKARPIEIKDFDISRMSHQELNFRVKCSKGTYIRSLAHDFGQALQSGAYLTSLRREMIGQYSVNDAQDIQTVISWIENVANVRGTKS